MNVDGGPKVRATGRRRAMPSKVAKSKQQRQSHSGADSIKTITQQLPPVQSLLTIGSGPNSAFVPLQQQQIDPNSFYSSAPACNQWNSTSTMMEPMSIMRYNSSQFFNPADEFLFTAQQMAAQIFDQVQNVGGSSVTSAAVAPDCAFYQQLQQQQQQSAVDDVSQYFYGVNGADAGFQLPSRGADLAWSDMMPVRAFNSNTDSNTASSSGDFASSDKSSPVEAMIGAEYSGPAGVMQNSSEDCTALSDRQTVFMLPPPINYRRRNERERERVRCVNDGYARLREIIPTLRSRQKRISKVETLRAASRYIRSLLDALAQAPSH